METSFLSQHLFVTTSFVSILLLPRHDPYAPWDDCIFTYILKCIGKYSHQPKWIRTVDEAVPILSRLLRSVQVLVGICQSDFGEELTRFDTER